MDNKDFTIICLILGILLLGISLHFCGEETLKELPELNSQFYEWGQNVENANEVGFSFWLNNFGDEEIKNINMKCKILDENDNTIWTKTKNVGNLGSKTSKYNEIFYKYQLSDNTKETGVCFIESCDNCKILWKEIPQFYEDYKEEKNDKNKV